MQIIHGNVKPVKYVIVNHNGTAIGFGALLLYLDVLW